MPAHRGPELGGDHRAPETNCAGVPARSSAGGPCVERSGGLLYFEMRKTPNSGRLDGGGDMPTGAPTAQLVIGIVIGAPV